MLLLTINLELEICKKLDLSYKILFISSNVPYSIPIYQNCNIGPNFDAFKYN